MKGVFYTARTRPKRDDGLTVFRAGSAWVYADSAETFSSTVARHCSIVHKTLQKEVLCNSSYLAACCRKDPTLASFEREYLLFLGNASAARGLTHKIVCQSFGVDTYNCFFAGECAEETRTNLEQIWELSHSGEILTFKAIAEVLYGSRKGAFYWAKALIEHLVHLHLLSHHDEWSVKR